MGSTIRHNRARGTHNIELMSHIVAELDKAGMSDQWIMKNIGMDRDELLRTETNIRSWPNFLLMPTSVIPQPKPAYIPIPENDDEVKSE